MTPRLHAQMSFCDLIPVNGEHERLRRALHCSKNPQGVDSVKEMSFVTHLLQRFRTVSASYFWSWATNSQRASPLKPLRAMKPCCLQSSETSAGEGLLLVFHLPCECGEQCLARFAWNPQRGCLYAPGTLHSSNRITFPKLREAKSQLFFYTMKAESGTGCTHFCTGKTNHPIVTYPFKA